MAAVIAKVNDADVAVRSTKAGEQSVPDVVAIAGQVVGMKSIVNLRSIVACKLIVNN